MLNKLSRLLDEAGILLTDHQKNQLVAYVGLLDKWNKAYNLTSVRDPNEMLVRHILDSIVVAPYLQGSRFIDVGTGPGLPGIPLAIVRPESHFTLLDSLGKRVRFLRQVQHELKLDNVTPVQSRVEAFPAEPPFDGVISRAFASLNDNGELVPSFAGRERSLLCAQRVSAKRRNGKPAGRVCHSRGH